MGTYQTRHLTARENQLVDRLALLPRYAKVVERLRPSKPVPKAKAKPEPTDVEQVEIERVAKPKPKTAR
jgi:hypothetical protein